MVSLLQSKWQSSTRDMTFRYSMLRPWQILFKGLMKLKESSMLSVQKACTHQRCTYRFEKTATHIKLRIRRIRTSLIEIGITDCLVYPCCSAISSAQATGALTAHYSEVMFCPAYLVLSAWKGNSPALKSRGVGHDRLQERSRIPVNEYSAI